MNKFPENDRPGLLVRIPALVLVALSFYLSSRPALPSMPSFRFADKLAHFVCFGAIAASLTWWFSLQSWKKHRLRNALLCVLFTSAYGIIDELHQFFVPGRSCDPFDWIADTLGAFPGCAAGYLLMKLVSKCRAP
ncbi:MAG: VanZ family protein [Treponema sp.]|nr:VanZ family protein [Treponema sp.]